MVLELLLGFSVEPQPPIWQPRDLDAGVRLEHEQEIYEMLSLS